jgi:AcrR family transcriptional regulator
MLETRSLDDLSVRTVTAATGVSPTALYLQFADLRELLREVKRRFFAELGDQLRQASAQHTGDARGRVRAIANAYLEFARSNPGRYAVISHVDKRSNTTSGPPEELVAAGFAAFEPLIDAVGAVLAGVERAEVFETAVELWLGLHGRAQLSAAMPWFELPAESRYVDRLVRHVLPS